MRSRPANGPAFRPRSRRWLGALLLTLIFVGLVPAPVSAHPADRVLQHLFVRITGDRAAISIALGGGILANEWILGDLDTNRDNAADPAEQAAFLATYFKTFKLSLDGKPLPIDPASVRVTAPPDLETFHLGLAPIEIAWVIPLAEAHPGEGVRLSIENRYRLEVTDFRQTIEAGPGARIIDSGWPASVAKIQFANDPSGSLPDNNASTAADEWDEGGVIGRAKEILQRPKTPLYVVTLLAVFALLGALHAAQPGHGKTLVAAWLVATGGTPRDALILAGVVTFTHTISVFALGLLTVAASQFFLPSRVIPVLGVFSGLLVVAMGVAMMRNAVRRSAAQSGHHHHEHDHTHEHSHLHADTHDQGHAAIDDEAHTRAHLADFESVLKPADPANPAGRRRVSLRSLVTLGVSGGIAPCPDALAILLLSVGIGQTMFGMVAILAFSLGLAGVLVAFGLAVASAGPLWKRVRARSGAAAEPSPFFGKLVAYGPVVSASVVLLLGVAMLWRASWGA